MDRYHFKCMHVLSTVSLLIAMVWINSCGGGDGSTPAASQVQNTINNAAYIPAECYTRTTDATGRTYNNCYVCHGPGKKPNLTDDKALQLEFAFPDYAMTNHWTNLFEDRSADVAAIGDTEIRNYIRQTNYFNPTGRILLADRLQSLPEGWDQNGNGAWDGYVPDCYYNFNTEGFDAAPDGSLTGWRALAYYPFPSTHWPTNGDMADVLIRLPEAFRTANGVPDITAYKINLAVLEALFRQADVAIDAVSEAEYNVDLNKDGELGTATHVAYDWAPLEDRHMSYVGDAKPLQEQNNVHLAANLYPEGTEFLNTLRYIDVNASGDIVMAARFKEIRYAVKTKWLTYAELESLAMDEIKEREDFPDRLRMPIGNGETGVSNGKGWRMRGFIEDAQGELRPQTSEETTSCIGCHGGMGINADSTFAFARKLDASSFQRGWFHWSQKGLEGINEPKVEIQKAGLQYEYSFYLMYNRGADAFRSNQEAAGKFLDDQGFLRGEMAALLHDDISLLLLPSADRGMQLNKRYKLIVEDQSFMSGRRPLLASKDIVYDKLTHADVDTKIEEPVVMTVQAVDPAPAVPPTSAGAPVAAELEIAIVGNGMTGPDGTRYGPDWSGVIGISTYALNVEGAFFPFPQRHTLPTRMILPNGKIGVCYECHRIPAPQPPEDPKLTLPVPIPPTTGSESGLELTRLTDDTASDMGGEWSPDGTRIAWVSNRTGNYQIWVMNADGTQKAQVTQEPMVHGWTRWSPDSTSLVYWGFDPATQTHGIYTRRADGSDPRTIVTATDYLDRPDWHPNGQDIAYAALSNGNWDVWVAQVGAREIELFRMTTSPDMESNPLWHPDGSAIAYKVAPSGEYSLTIQNILTFEGGYANPTIHQWESAQAIQMNDWSPDGGCIAYTAEILTNASGEDRISYAAVVEEVAYANGTVTPGNPVVLANRCTLGDRGPVFSPDGQQVAFWAWDKSYRATLWVSDSEGSNLQQVTTLGFDMAPQWRPDGGALLFESRRNGNMDIWTVELSGAP